MEKGPLKKGYLVGSVGLYYYILFSDVFYKAIALFYRHSEKRPNKCNKILLSNGAHYGDVLLSLRLIPLIKKYYPDSKIGFLTGSWNIDLVKKCDGIDYVHIVDHWVLNRKKIGLLKKIKIFFLTREHALNKIKAIGYNTSIDLYYHFPNNSFLFLQAGIERRIGYFCNGGKPLLTDPVFWKYKNQHNVEYQVELLKKIGIKENLKNVRRPEFHFKETDENVLNRVGLNSKKYILIHIGTGDANREWPLEKWIDLCKIISVRNETLVFTGAGAEENQKILCITESLKGRFINLCNKIMIEELIQVVRNAKVFIGVNSFAGHIAALYELKQISIFHGAVNKYHWKPYNERCVLIEGCCKQSPCFDEKKCKLDFACIKNIEVERVVEALNMLLDEN